jgi:hypothetical protein
MSDPSAAMNRPHVLRDQCDNNSVREEDVMLAAQRKLDVLFRPAEGGYVFRAPNPWIL